MVLKRNEKVVRIDDKTEIVVKANLTEKQIQKKIAEFHKKRQENQNCITGYKKKFG